MSVVYRVDKFVVPDQAREEFWSHVRRTHLVLRDQPGFIADYLLEQIAGPGRCRTSRGSSGSDSRLEKRRRSARNNHAPRACHRRNEGRSPTRGPTSAHVPAPVDLRELR